MNSHSVEISIAGCVEAIVRDPNLRPIFSFFHFFHVLCINNYWEQRLRAALAMVKKKTPSPLIHPAPGKKTSTQVSLVRDQPHTSRTK